MCIQGYGICTQVMLGVSRGMFVYPEVHWVIGVHLFLEGKIRPPGQKFNLDFNILNLGRKYIMYKKINNIRYIPAILHILK